MPAVARHQEQKLHPSLWILMGLLLAFTTLFVGRITWLIAHTTHKPHPHSHPITHHHLSKLHHAPKTSLNTKLPNIMVIDEAHPQHTHTASTPTSPIPLMTSKTPHMAAINNSVKTPTPEITLPLHLAAFFKPESRENVMPKTIVPSFVPPSPPQTEPPVQMEKYSAPIATTYQKPVKQLTKTTPQVTMPALSSVDSIPGAMPVQTRVMLASQHLQQGQYQEALLLINHGLQQYPHYHPLLKLKALILVALQQPDAALDLLRENEPDISRDPDWYAFIAGLYQREGDHENAASYYQRVLTQRPDRGNWWVGLAISQEALGQRDAALQSYQRAQEAALSPPLAAYVNERIHVL